MALKSFSVKIKKQKKTTQKSLFYINYIVFMCEYIPHIKFKSVYYSLFQGKGEFVLVCSVFVKESLQFGCGKLVHNIDVAAQ